MNWRRAAAFGHDILAVGVAWVAAYWLRFNLNIPSEFSREMFAHLPWVVGLYAILFLAFRLYRGLWRFASLPDLQRILVSVGIGAIALPALLVLVGGTDHVPRSVYLIMPMLLVGAMSGNRLLYRAWKEQRILGLVIHPGAEPVLVIGAGSAGAALVKELHGNAQWRVVGFLDDNKGKLRATIQGVKILGIVNDVGQVAEHVGAKHAIIAMPGADHAARRRAVELCAAANLKVMTVPAYADIVSGKVSVSTLRNVELDDLLGRDPVILDDAGLHELLTGKRVLVTGAGGSIGSELCRQIARFAPAKLVLFEMSEFALYAIEQEFRDRYSNVPIVVAIGDAKSDARVKQVFEDHEPQIVFHAAAYKHVPLMEGCNAYEAVANNVRSTATVARAAQRARSEKFVLISTDKAVNPTNVMGASKRLAELLCQARQARDETQFVIVRFGNVLGSTGSVIPRFREQIARGGPVTVTHPEIQRYFMSIPEAAQLVLQAALMGHGGEIFVLDMGEPVRIVDLARQLIRLSGFSGDDIKIEFTGLRPGEKLYEELLADAERTVPTRHPKLRIAKSVAVPQPGLEHEVVEWLGGGNYPENEVRAQLARWIPEYRAPSA